jgi:hypothetical protein
MKSKYQSDLKKIFMVIVTYTSNLIKNIYQIQAINL